MRHAGFGLVVAITIAAGARGARAAEVFDRDFYRSPSGLAVLRLPALGSEWTLLPPYSDGATRALRILHGKPGAFDAWVEARFPPAGAGDSKAAAQLVAAGLAKAGFTPTAEQVAGPAYMIALTGKNKVGTPLMGVALGLASGGQPFGLAVLTTKETAPRTQAMLTLVLKGLRLGASVPRLPARDPGQRLAGVYQGPTTSYTDSGGYMQLDKHWLVFDPRGYALDEEPEGDLGVDLEARYQRDPASVQTFTAKGGALVLVSARGAAAKPVKLEAKGRDLMVGGERYRRVDGLTEGLVLDGHYQSSSYSGSSNVGGTIAVSSSADYYFQKSGHFSTKRFAGLSGTTRAASGTTTGTIAGTAENPSQSGSYRVTADHLVLTFGDSTVVMHTFYATDAKGGMFDIDGDSYLRQ